MAGAIIITTAGTITTNFISLTVMVSTMAGAITDGTTGITVGTTTVVGVLMVIMAGATIHRYGIPTTTPLITGGTILPIPARMQLIM